MKKVSLENILNETSVLKEKKVGFIAIIGRPNVGKSSFVNALIGEKISITTNIPQTTRKKILAIYNDEDSQIIFFDTPGIHKSEKLLNMEINNSAISSLAEADLILYFIDSTREGGIEENYIKEIIAKTKKLVIKVYTKSDLLNKNTLKDNQIKISSKTKEGFLELIEKIKSNLKIQITPFPDEYYTKQDLYFRISEIIREKVFLNTKEEIPHSIYVEVEEIEEKENLLKISSYIYTETESQKYIIIGKNGTLISKIGKEARIELESIFSKKVFLTVRVKVKKGWKKDENLIKKILG